MENQTKKEECGIFGDHQYEFVTAAHGAQVFKCLCGHITDVLEDSQP